MARQAGTPSACRVRTWMLRSGRSRSTVARTASLTPPVRA